MYCILYMNMCIISNKILLKKLPFIQSFHWLVRDSSAVRWLFSICCSRGTSADLPTDPLLAGNTRKNAISRPAAGHTRKNALSPAAGHRFHPQNHPPKIDAKLVKKDNSNSIKIGCTTPQDNLTSCFYNHNELDLSNGFFREEEVFV